MNVLFSKITSDPFRIFSRLARQSRRHPHTRVHKNIGDLSNNSSPEKLGPTHGLATFDWSPAPFRPTKATATVERGTAVRSLNYLRNLNRGLVNCHSYVRQTRRFS